MLRNSKFVGNLAKNCGVSENKKRMFHNKRTVEERPDAKAREKPSQSFLDESLILAQDERWRRA